MPCDGTSTLDPGPSANISEAKSEAKGASEQTECSNAAENQHSESGALLSENKSEDIFYNTTSIQSALDALPFSDTDARIPLHVLEQLGVCLCPFTTKSIKRCFGMESA